MTKQEREKLTKACEAAARDTEIAFSGDSLRAQLHETIRAEESHVIQFLTDWSDCIPESATGREVVIRYSMDRDNHLTIRWEMVRDVLPTTKGGPR
jgi:hypothetical protein